MAFFVLCYWLILSIGVYPARAFDNVFIYGSISTDKTVGIPNDEGSYFAYSFVYAVWSSNLVYFDWIGVWELSDNRPHQPL